MLSDTVFDLFTGYVEDGEPEKKVLKVIQNNLSWRFFLEIVISLGPQALTLYINDKDFMMINWIYGLFKIFRYLRLSEFDSLISDILEFYEEDKTEHELKQIQRSLDIANFGTTTLVNLHMLTVAMVMMCQTKDDFTLSWLGGAGVSESDNVAKYVTSLYFVTTTLSTCGFGDLTPTSGDTFEVLFVLCLQFVGMFFYSSTIDRIQGYLDYDEISAAEYANYMVEELEGLIVRVGKVTTNTVT